MRNRALWDAYINGVITFCNYGTRDCGMTLEGRKHEDAFRDQGFYDARDKRVLSRTAFDRETVLRRIEVRETEGVAREHRP